LKKIIYLFNKNCMGKDKPPKCPSKPITNNIGYASVDINGNVSYHSNEKNYTYKYCLITGNIICDSPKGGGFKS